MEQDDPLAPKRGADLWGHDIAREYRQRSIASDGYDPALEWYREVHMDPHELARLVAENNAAVEEMLNLKPGTLS